MTERLPASVEIVEVGPRDGLQDEHELVSTADKIAYVEAVVRAGLRRVEVASFVDPRRVPQMGDAEAVLAGLARASSVHGLSLIGLVLNGRGMDRALASGVAEINVAVGVTDTFSEQNAGMSSDAAAAMWAGVAARAHEAGIRAGVTLSVAFGCPYEGRVGADRVVATARRVAASGPFEISLADTIGAAVPTQTEDLVAAVITATGLPVRCHLHNSRNTGLANAVGALAGGASALDASTGGIGGCPFAPGASGNIATEDLVHMLHGMGVSTGIDVALLLDAVQHVERITGHPSIGMLSRAGAFPKG